MLCTPFRGLFLSFVFVLASIGFFSLQPPQAAEAAPADVQLEFETTMMYENISIALSGELTNVVINWGDLDSDPVTPDVTETIPNQGPGAGEVVRSQSPDFDGRYVVSISATKIERFGKCLQGSDNTLKKVLSWGNVGLTSLQCGLDHRAGVIQVPSTIPATVTNLSNMFSYANAFNQDISTWDTSNVTNMAGMFESSVSFNHSLASWNITNVTNMTDIFKKVVSYSMSNENYSSTLASWGAQTVRPNLNLGTVSMQVVTCAGFDGRAALLASPNNWTISDVAPSGLNCNSGNNNQNSNTNNNTQTETIGAQLAQTGSSYDWAIVLSLFFIMSGVMLSHRKSKL